MVERFIRLVVRIYPPALILFIIASIFNAAGYSQTLTASVSPQSVRLGEPVTVTFTFTAGESADTRSFRPPDFTDCRLTSGVSTSTSIEIFNGRTTSRYSFSYTVVPARAGKISIGSASIRYRSQTITSKPISVTVSGSGTLPQQDEQQEPTADETIEDFIFLRASCDKSECYVGEQVTVTFTLYTRINIDQAQSVKIPAYDNFWAEELDQPAEPNPVFDIVNGKEYTTYVIKKMALFPSKEGKIFIPPFSFEAEVSSFSLARLGIEPGKYTIESDSVALTVKPLPKTDLASFTGAVGVYSMTAKLDQNKTRQNEPVTLKISLRGTGNIKLIRPPDFNPPENIIKYDSKVEESVVRKNYVNGSKSFSYLLVPGTAGRKEIEPIEFTYFNPDKEEYVTLRSTPFSFEVNPGEQKAENNLSDDGIILEADIRDISTDTASLDRPHDFLFQNPVYWACYLFPPVIFAFLLRRHRKRIAFYSDSGRVKFSFAQKVAQKRLAQAKVLLKAERFEAFYEEVSRAFLLYLEDKIQLDKSDFSREFTRKKMSEIALSESIIENTISAIEQCDFARYAPGAMTSAEAQQLFTKAAETIASIESELRKFERKAAHA